MPESRRSSEDNGHPKRWVVIVGVLVAVALLGLIVFLHLTGVIGPGLH